MKKEKYYRYNLYLKGICLIAFIAGTMYYSSYNVNNSLEDIEAAVSKEVNAGLPYEAYSVKLSQELDIEDKKYVTGTVNDNVAVVELKKGINNNYKINRTSYGTDLFNVNSFSNGNNNYIVIQCKNSEEEISYIKFNLDDDSYRIDMKNEGEFFIGYCKTKKLIEHIEYTLEDLMFFNNNDEDITDKVELTKPVDPLTGRIGEQVVIK